jgi:hypothetical protein
MALVDMAMSAEEAQEESCCSPAASGSDPNAPKYPYGLSISLNEESMAKLGLTQMPGVGTKVRITAECTVTDTSAYQTQGGETEQRVGLQITDMEVGDAQDGADDTPDIATALYGGNSMGSAPSGV